jgi:hypothetical protein
LGDPLTSSLMLQRVRINRCVRRRPGSSA